MALPGTMTRTLPSFAVKGAAEDRIKPFGDESEKLQTHILQVHQALRIARQQLSSAESQASFILLFSLANKLDWYSATDFLPNLVDWTRDDILYDYKLSSMPNSVEEGKAEFVYAGKGEPKFHIDFEID